MSHEHLSFLLLGLALIFGLSKLFNIIFNALKMPPVLGELGAGLLVATLAPFFTPGTFWAEQVDFLKNSELIYGLGELGILLLLFEVGLETDLADITGVGMRSLVVAIAGVACPFFFTWSYAAIAQPEWGWQLTLFMGLVMAATSIGITARVFKDLNVLDTINAKVVLAAAVIDDVLGLMLLSVVSALIASGSFEWTGLFVVVFKVVLFLGLALWFSSFGLRLIGPVCSRLVREDTMSFLMWLLTFVLFISYLAELVGLAPIVGAFATGIALDRLSVGTFFGEDKKIEDYIVPLRAFLSPIFFFKVGISVVPGEIFSATMLILLALAMASKMICGFVLPGERLRDRLVTGLGMIPRGEVGIIVAEIGRSMGIVDLKLHTAIVGAVIGTTIIAPILLQMVIRPSSPKSDTNVL